MRGHARSVLGSALAVLLALAPAATPGPVQYAYDAMGRLSVVADDRGDLAVYEYDAVGNLLAIRRMAVADVPDTVLIALVAPPAARRGATISIFGKGFAETPHGNDVTFNGVRASVTTAAPTRLTVEVPSGATTGPIRLDTARGTAISPDPFRVLGALAVEPPTAVVAPGGRVQFTVSGDGVASVRWSVDGILGGDAARGTIASDGLYVAPATLAGGAVTVAATSLADPALEATARVTMLASRSLFVAAPSLVAGAVPTPRRLDVTTAASVGIATPTAFALAAPLALRVAPVVLDVTPADGARGEILRIHVTGAGFDGATRMDFLMGAAADPAVAVTGLVVTPDGSEAIADVVIAANAGLGPRIVRVVTPAGASTGAVAGDNVFTVR